MKQTLGILLLAFTLITAQQAKADTYVGGLIGYGFDAGNVANVTGGLAVGATAGLQLVPNLGVAVTYLRNFEKFTNTTLDYGVSQYLVEFNFFSVLFFPSGVHIGQIHSDYNGATSNDLGFGLHTGFDVHIMGNMTIGGAAYWTYVTEQNNKHSVFDIVVPVKFHF